MKAELKLHKHPQSRKGKTSNDMKKELLDHYSYVHDNFNTTALNVSVQKVACYCQTDENEQIEEVETWIGCDFEDCSIAWFHLRCLKRMNIDYPLPENIETRKTIFFKLT